MTTRIYYTEPSCREFDAVVIEAMAYEGRPAAILDRTAFYPTSGGQPFDTGQLGTARVVDVIDDDDRVVHVLDTPLRAGTPVHGRIDWERRFDHMQQHTGQHVLSAAFENLHPDSGSRVADSATRLQKAPPDSRSRGADSANGHAGGNRTVSFHLGEDLSSIDLEREASWSEIDAAVDAANRVIWDDRPVSIRSVSDAEAATLPLRKPPSRAGTLRLIDVSGFDLSACGGTHVSRTGAIGMIAVTAAEKFKGGSRITFAAGGRALRVLRTYREAIAGSVRALSVLPDQLPDAIARLQLDLKDLRKANSRLQEQLAVHEAERMFGRTPASNGMRHVIEVISGFDAQALKVMAVALAANGGTLAALVSAQRPAFVVIARSAGLSADANALLRQLMAEFGGKGGGKADLAQGGGIDAEPDAIVSALRRLISVAADAPISA